MHLGLISRSRQILLSLPMLFASTMALSACGAGAPAPATTAPKTPVRIQLAWVHEYSSTSFYAADKHGYFAAQNLDVRLEPGGFGPQGYIEPIAQVVNGTAEPGRLPAWYDAARCLEIHSADDGRSESPGAADRPRLLDVTGVPVIDTQVARVLLQAADAARLLGAEPILVGIRPELAQTIVGLGLDLSSLKTQADLQSSIRYAAQRQVIRANS